jgi:tetratricopeptide (TPR) repeat protein
LWGAQNDLAVALWEKRRIDEAIQHMQRSLELSPVSAQIYEAFVSDPGNRQPKGENLDAEYRKRLDAVMASILNPPQPLRLEDVPLGGPSPAATHSTPQGISTPSDVFQRGDEPIRESPGFDSLVAGLEIPRLWRLAAHDKDNDKVDAAQRQILRIFLHSFETGTFLVTKQRYAQASMCFGVAAQAAPENPYILYTLARALALDKQENKALKTLERAAEKGFNDSGQVAGDQAFDGLRDRADYRKAVAQMRPSGS